MLKLLNRKHLTTGIAFTCSIVTTSIIGTSTFQVMAQSVPGKVLIAQSAVDEEVDLKFDSRGCRRTKPGEVTCDVLITNTGNKRQLLRFRNQGFGVPPTNAIDSSGTVYGTTLVQLGTYIAKPYYYVEPDLTPGIPTKITFIFEIPREVTQLAALDLSYEPLEPNKSSSSLKKMAIPNIGEIASKSPSARNPGNCTCPPSSTSTRQR